MEFETFKLSILLQARIGKARLIYYVIIKHALFADRLVQQDKARPAHTLHFCYFK